VNEDVSRDMTGEADGMNQGVDSRDGVMHIVGRLGSGGPASGSDGSGVRVRASFLKKNCQPRGSVREGPRLADRIGSGVRPRGTFHIFT